MTIAVPTRAGRRPGRDLEPPPVVPAQRAADCPEVRARAAAGDADAFGQLYHACHDVVFRYIYRKCGDRQLAEDLAHETWVRALRRVDTFQEKGRPFASWLVTIARNIVTDHWKSASQRLCVSVDMRLEGIGTDVSRALVLEEDPAQEVVDRDARRLLDAAMRDLTDAQREVLELRYFCGLSVRDTAQKMGLHEGATKALTYRAVQALARHRLLQQLHPAVAA